MLCASLRDRGEEFVAWPRTLAQFRDGRMTAIPFVHPWGNRLETREYRVGRRRVDLRGVDLPTDPNGLPMHGNLSGAPFAVTRAEASERGTRLVAALDYGARPDLLRAFPFPHVVTIDARLDHNGLRLNVEVEPTGRSAVPISFCWHPFLQIPDAPRRDWELRWPRCERVLVDERVIPDRRADTATGRARAPRRPHLRRSLRARNRPPVRPARRASVRSTFVSVRPIRSGSCTYRHAATSRRSNR